MLVTVANGAQAMLMAPTEILAEQHHHTISSIVANLPQKPRVELLTGSLRAREKKEIREELATGAIDIAVGTHALIQEGVEFKNLALAVIDEQHRFGVEQRAAIRQRGTNPHILVMSATPIPRTLALTVYGDLDLSIIDEMPPGRREIKTRVLTPRERERAYQFIRKEVNAGRQVFIILPLIEESEAIEAKAAVEEHERLSRDIFPDFKLGLLHGRMRPADKDAVMAKFRGGELNILVSTSVVEVGIDVPNATVMLIENAERFGLAQLHQFRGRVGRGAFESYCILICAQEDNERVKVIESVHNGFRLAEEDLKLRGPGEFFGTRQSGLPDLKVAKLADVKILEEARTVAQELFEQDPDLARAEHQLLAQKVREFWRGEGDLS
jgi:ATP-dependent DNA helicase RecG